MDGGLNLGIEHFGVVDEHLLVVVAYKVVEDVLPLGLTKYRTYLNHGDNAVSVDDNGGGITLAGEAGESEVVFSVAYLEEGNVESLALIHYAVVVVEIAVVISEVCCNVIGIIVDTENSNVVLVVLVHSVDVGELVRTVGTVNVPEVEHNHILGLEEGGELVRFTVDIGESEVVHNVTELVGILEAAGSNRR